MNHLLLNMLLLAGLVAAGEARAASTDYPIIGLSADKVCSDLSYYDAKGVLTKGTLNCGGASAATCASDGAKGCVTTTDFPAVKAASLSAGTILAGTTLGGVAGTVSSCASDGATGCVATTTFKGADTSKLSAASFASGTSIAGVTGTAILEAHATCSKDGAVGCATSSSYAAAAATGLGSKLLSDATVAGLTGNVTLPPAAMVRASNGAFGSGGTAITPTLADCSTDGAVGCVATTSFKSANMAVATAANITAAATVAGITGTHSPACNSDGQTGCTATGAYKSAAAVATTDLRSGRTLGGVSGNLKTNCRNGVNNTYYNFDGAVGSLPATSQTGGTTPDFWDTVDDYNNFAATLVMGWSTDNLCDSSMWQDVTTADGGTTTTSCGANPTNCQYKDLISGLTVTKLIASSMTWSSTMIGCSATTYGGYSAGSWRLPTQKELMSLHAHGIAAVGSSNFITLAQLQTSFWSATTFAALTTYAWYVSPATGLTTSALKTGAQNYLCVR